MARDGIHWQARVVFATGGVKTNQVSNGWNFNWSGTGTPTSAQLTSLAQVVRDFYITTTTFGGKVSNNFGTQISTAANTHTVDMYSLDLTDPHHYYGSPVVTLPFTVTAVGSGANLPNECAIAYSFRAGYGSDPEHDGTTRPRASDRGRIYLGPLCATARQDGVDIYGTQFAEVASATIANVQAAGQTMKSAAFALQFLWSVWSRKEAVFKQITQHCCDGQFDTIRKRSIATPLLAWTALS